MASGSDNILAGILGALQGAQSAYQPYAQAQLQNKQNQQELQNKLAYEQQMLPIQNQAKLNYSTQEAQAMLPIQQKQMEMQQPFKLAQIQAEKPADYISGSDIQAAMPNAQVDPKQKYNKSVIPLFKQDVTMGDKENQHQDALETKEQARFDKITSNRSGGLGRESGKVDSAIHARNLIEGARNPKTGQVELNQIQSPELALALSNIVSGSSGGTGNVETFKAMQPQALSKTIKEKIGYLFGEPVDVMPKAWTDQLTHMLDRQGTTAEDLRDKYMDDFAKTSNSGLNPERMKKFIDTKRGNSYREIFKIPKGEGGINQASAGGGGNADIIPNAGQKSGFDADVIAYAKTHSITPQQAQQIKAQRTSGGVGR